MSRLFVLLLIPFNVLAQGGYAGQETREIKALSADEVKQYESGAGMGYARAAELNHYPGPMHALEHADALKLTPEQRTSLQALMNAHKAEARAVGAKLVAAERELDRLFREGKATPQSLREKVQAAALLRGEYRLTHLETHLKTRALLTEEQVRRYDELRGYAKGASPAHGAHQRKH